MTDAVGGARLALVFLLHDLTELQSSLPRHSLVDQRLHLLQFDLLFALLFLLWRTIQALLYNADRVSSIFMTVQCKSARGSAIRLNLIAR